ncbi:fimbria/pilus periplasmic chaperone [Caballeronia sp. LZ034LL]|uniref:fimbria/pilus periplasmic chaperone n=1 Tax=Caballeronia sp. LZ034LL TaxID=3038567 RepID=UPI00285AEAA5|nr:fimbria/pilus periplasmic chaperone [Caballeronia sp. LZ034LL]MDR5833367.1 fimbria/pilus periplasmic chaperone [Caballeronia sp. LZ034LL]
MSTQSLISKSRSIISRLHRGKKLFLDRGKTVSNKENTISSQNSESAALFNSLAIGARSITIDTNSKQAKLAVQNVGDSAIVLLPSIQRFPETQTTSVMVTPLMMELQSGESAAVEYILLTADAETEQLFRARFEWFQSYANAATQEAETSIPLLVRPAGLTPEDHPCESLCASMNKFGDVIIENRSAHIAFLSPVVALVPCRRTFVLPQRYIAPQSWQLCRGVALGVTPSAIRISVETSTGIPTSSVDLQLRPWLAAEHFRLRTFK